MRAMLLPNPKPPLAKSPLASPLSGGRQKSWHIEGRMIRNHQELAVTRERVAKFERLLEDLRKNARPEEWPELSSGYRLEIERMQRDILDYLVQAPPGAKRTTAA